MQLVQSCAGCGGQVRVIACLEDPLVIGKILEHLERSGPGTAGRRPYRDGTTHVVFGPRDFIARLAARVPTPRVHLTRYHGVFAPHSQWRAQITPAGRGSGAKAMDTRTPAERHRAMSWAQRLKRVFKLDLSSCEGCVGQVRVIACVEDSLVIGKILEHLEKTGPGPAGVGWRPEVRGPPQGRLDLG